MSSSSPASEKSQFRVTENVSVHMPPEGSSSPSRLGRALAGLAIAVAVATGGATIFNFAESRAAEAAAARVALIQSIQESAKAPACLQGQRVSCTTQRGAMTAVYDSQGHMAFVEANGDIVQTFGFKGASRVVTPNGTLYETNGDGNVIRHVSADGVERVIDAPKSSGGWVRTGTPG